MHGPCAERLGERRPVRHARRVAFHAHHDAVERRRRRGGGEGLRGVKAEGHGARLGQRRERRQSRTRSGRVGRQDARPGVPSARQLCGDGADGVVGHAQQHHARGGRQRPEVVRRHRCADARRQRLGTCRGATENGADGHAARVQPPREGRPQRPRAHDGHRPPERVGPVGRGAAARRSSVSEGVGGVHAKAGWEAGRGRAGRFAQE